MKYLFVCVSLLASSIMYGQTDIVSWSSIRLQTKTVNGYRIALAPIVRHSNDLSSYANSSLDVIIRKSFGQGFSAQFLYRHWWMKDSPNRVFWWFDFGHGFRISDKWRASNRVRWHIAKDYLVDEDPNFIRYLPQARYQLSKKLGFDIGFELWLQLDGVADFRRIRPQAGFTWKINNRMSFSSQYWYEKSIVLDPGFLNHTINSSLNYTLH